MRIGYIGIKGLPSKAGADRVVEAIVQRLAEQHELTVYCSPLVVPAAATYPGVELVRVPVLRGKHLHATSLFTTSALHALTRDYDLIHVHNMEASFILPLLKLRHKVIVTSHGAKGHREKWGRPARALIRVARWPARLADCITTVAEPQVQLNERQYRKTVKYIPNGVDLEESGIDLAAARDLLRAYDVEPGRYILFAAGRVIPTKGARLLLRAYRNLATELNLLIVGDASQLPAYEKTLHHLADSRVVFIPFVDKPVLLGLVRLASFFVFPSTMEAMSMMLLEAASQELPLVCSDIHENTTVLPHHALYFKSGDPDSLLDRMYWALHHPDEMRELGTGARAWVMEHYLWDSIVPQYEELYHAIAGTDGTACA